MRLRAVAAILMVMLSGPVSAVHAARFEPEAIGGAVSAHAHAPLLASQASEDDAHLPSGALPHHHCAACPCVHVYSADVPEDAPLCQEPVAVAYQLHPENDAAKHAPEPPRKPPRH